MAVIEVTGNAARIFYGGKGVSVVEFYKTQTGEVKQRKYTAWFNEPVTFTEGSVGIFRGILSTKIEKWVDQDGNPKKDSTGAQGQSVQVSINNAEFKPSKDAPVTAAVANQVLSGAWTPVTADIDDSPF